MTVVNLHPPISPGRTVEIGGETFVDVDGVIALARGGDTAQCRALYRFYVAEHRALEGQPLAANERKWQAFQAAWARMVRKFGVAPLGPERQL